MPEAQLELELASCCARFLLPTRHSVSSSRTAHTGLLPSLRSHSPGRILASAYTVRSHHATGRGIAAPLVPAAPPARLASRGSPRAVTLPWTAWQAARCRARTRPSPPPVAPGCAPPGRGWGWRRGAAAALPPVQGGGQFRSTAWHFLLGRTAGESWSFAAWPARGRGGVVAAEAGHRLTARSRNARLDSRCCAAAVPYARRRHQLHQGALSGAHSAPLGIRTGWRNAAGCA